jgi:pyruvate/2-oxoacid:ferredoxin oxidoreductase alpha subunit
MPSESAHPFFEALIQKLLDMSKVRIVPEPKESTTNQKAHYISALVVTVLVNGMGLVSLFIIVEFFKGILAKI